MDITYASTLQLLLSRHNNIFRFKFLVHVGLFVYLLPSRSIMMMVKRQFSEIQSFRYVALFAIFEFDPSKYKH